MFSDDLMREQEGEGEEKHYCEEQAKAAAKREELRRSSVAMEESKAAWHERVKKRAQHAAAPAVAAATMVQRLRKEKAALRDQIVTAASGGGASAAEASLDDLSESLIKQDRYERSDPKAAAESKKAVEIKSRWCVRWCSQSRAFTASYSWIARGRCCSLRYPRYPHHDQPQRLRIRRLFAQRPRRQSSVQSRLHPQLVRLLSRFLTQRQPATPAAAVAAEIAAAALTASVEAAAPSPSSAAPLSAKALKLLGTTEDEVLACSEPILPAAMRELAATEAAAQAEEEGGGDVESPMNSPMKAEAERLFREVLMAAGEAQLEEAYQIPLHTTQHQRQQHLRQLCMSSGQRVSILHAEA